MRRAGPCKHVLAVRLRLGDPAVLAVADVGTIVPSNEALREIVPK
ncbi:hypothetical protein BH23GEM10_BH23GEM10_03320 [soil metagenome]